MVDYLTPTVIQPNILDTDISSFELLLLTHIFEFERSGDEFYFFAEDAPATGISIDRAELLAAIAESKDRPSSLLDAIQEQIAKAPPDQSDIDLDLSGESWEFLFQDIVGRSASLSYVTAVSSFTCTKMRPDGFGGMAVLITKDAIVGKSTHEILEDFLAEAGVDKSAHDTETGHD